MNSRKALRVFVFVAAAALAHTNAFAQAAQAPAQEFEPQVGQAGKDVVWVPTPQETVDKMLDMAKVTPQDFLMDLGSGDGRLVITAAKRGLRAEGIEYNPDMVALAEKNAKAAGVSARATFRKADIFETDFTKAQVITLFLLPQLNLKLRPTILNMKPGTRIVSNTFNMDDWIPDQTENLPDCSSWCTAYLWIVPAKVDGTWEVPGRGTLTLRQSFQMLSGSLGSTQIAQGKLRGDEISFMVGNTAYTGKVDGNTLRLAANGTNLNATKK